MPDSNFKGGWITLNRSIKKHWIWSNHFYAHLWIDLLLRANYETRKILINSELVTLHRGQFITSLKKLSKEYKCSISKIRTFLNLLKNDTMIDIKTTRSFTQITICNYSLYQDLKHTESIQKTHRKHTESIQKETENHITKKNNNSNHKTKQLFDEKSLEYQLSLLLYNQMKHNNPNLNKPDLQEWSSEFDLMINKDKRDDEHISEAILFSQENSFWKEIIHSPKKLRYNFQTILKQIK